MTPPRLPLTTGTSRKRSVSNLSAEGDYKRLRHNSTERTFLSISGRSTCRSPSPSLPSTASHTLTDSPPPSTPPPHTPRTHHFSALPQSSDQLLHTIPLTLHYHATSSLCTDSGLVSYHKGLTPGQPNGYYCCPSTEAASRQQKLRVLDNSILMEVLGPGDGGVVAYIEARDAAVVRSRVEAVEQTADGQRAVVCVEGFLKHRQCVPTAMPGRFRYSEDSWK